MPSVRALVVSISINNNMNLTLYAGTYLNNEIINKSNDVDIEYSDDTKSEAFKFEHPSTEQTTELVDYRYIGDNPNNYIYFNCTDSEDISTCELWRILGVFDVEDENGNIETRTKIIPNYSFYLMWDEENVNEWITSTGKRYLNDGEFWNKLSSTSKSMISPTKYYLGNSRGIANNSADGIYTEERSLNTEFNRSVNWVGNIGIIYPSDYGYMYSKGASSSCENNILSCYNDYSWLNEINDKEWT